MDRQLRGRCWVPQACVGVTLSLGFVGPCASGPAPSFAKARNYTTGSGPYSIALDDLNGDGKPDLATANLDANTVSVLLNRGDGRFGAKHDYRTGDGPESLRVGDLNGDGRPDLTTANF